MSRFYILGLVVLFFSSVTGISIVGAEDITLTTYYPGPEGAFKELETDYIDFANNVYQEASPANLPEGKEGRLFYDAVDKRFKFFDGTGWKKLTKHKFGEWQDRDMDTTYQAATDGIVVALAGGHNCGCRLYGYTDNSSSPATLRAVAAQTKLIMGTDGSTNSLTMPVLAGNYYKVVHTPIFLPALSFGESPYCKMYFIPLIEG